MAASFICRRFVLNDHELSDAFDLLDLDNDGELSRAEIGALLRTIKVEPNRTELNYIFDEIHSENGKIKKSEFLEYMKSPPIYKITVNELERLFREHDANADGFINIDELSRILTTTTGITDQKILEHLFNMVSSSSKDGLINYEQFLQLIRT